MALNHVGGGLVKEVKPPHGNWEIKIHRGMMKGKVEVFVDAISTVHTKEHSHMDMMDIG